MKKIFKNKKIFGVCMTLSKARNSHCLYFLETLRSLRRKKAHGIIIFCGVKPTK